jgi:hypothetical protein
VCECCHCVLCAISSKKNIVHSTHTPRMICRAADFADAQNTGTYPIIPLFPFVPLVTGPLDSAPLCCGTSPTHSRPLDYLQTTRAPLQILHGQFNTVRHVSHQPALPICPAGDGSIGQCSSVLRYKSHPLTPIGLFADKSSFADFARAIQHCQARISSTRSSHLSRW